MYKSDIKTSLHDWEKQNLVTISKGKKPYDEMVCRQCGMKGKRYNFTEVEVSGTYKEANAKRGPQAPALPAMGKIQITRKGFGGGAFANLLEGSIHAVITPPEGYYNDATGKWVMGVGEPVRVLPREFIDVKD